MRLKDEPLPSKEEAELETRKRLEVVEKIKPILEKFCEIAILVGSVAYGKNYSVRKESDIDLILLINRRNVDEIVKCDLFERTDQIGEAISFFEEGEIDHFSIVGNVGGVKVQYHFWDKAAHFRAERFEKPWPKVYNIFRSTGKLVGTDFSGNDRDVITEVKICGHGAIHEYPPYFIDEGHFILRQPIQNLIMDPDILFCKDEELYENIELIWKEIARRFVEEGSLDDPEKEIIFSLYGYWNFSPESRKKVEAKIQGALQGIEK
jgi:hypothetical protein